MRLSCGIRNHHDCPNGKGAPLKAPLESLAGWNRLLRMAVGGDQLVLQLAEHQHGRQHVLH